MTSETENKPQSLRDEVEGLRARVKNLEALTAGKGSTKSETSGWTTLFFVFLGVLLYRLFRYLFA